jgi:N-acetylneuraminic acid mutarotase
MRLASYTVLSCLLGMGGPAVSRAQGAEITPHLFPHMDGEADDNQGLNLGPVIALGGNSGARVGWITYQTGGADLAATVGSSLTVYIDSVHAAGTLKVFALTSALTLPEADVQYSDLSYDDLSPVATLALTTSDQEKVVRLDLDTLLSSGTFYGLVLEAHNGLRIDVGSKDSHLQPLIELRYAIATAAQVQNALDAAAAAEEAADSAAASATSAAGSASAASASATAAAGSATAAAGSASTAAGSATEAATSATQAATSASSAAGSASSASSSATAASGSASSASTSATAASSSASSASSSATAASGSASSASSSATAASGSASSASSSATAASGSASSAAGSASAASVSATNAANSASAAAGSAQAAYDFFAGGGKYLASTIPSGFVATGLRWHFEAPLVTKAAMTTARHYAASATLNDKLWVSGGSSNGTLQTALQSFDPSTNAWSSHAALPATLYTHTMAADNGKLYAIGGVRAGTSTVSAFNYRYDASTNTWSTLAAMPTARCALASAVIGGKIHVLGGSTNSSGTAFSTAHEVYDIANNTWSTAAALPMARGYASVAVIGGKIHLVGGLSTGSVVQSSHAVYDPANDTWSTAASLPAPRYSAGGVEAGDKLYVMGGAHLYGPDDPVASCLKYDPDTDAWYGLAQTMATDRFSFTPWEISGKVYLTGGSSGSASLSMTEEFTPPTTLHLVELD